MNRLERRTVVLRGKRRGAFDPDQYWLERAQRTRVARKVRARLRQMQPVVLRTPRWSAARRFLDDLGTDLLIGSPKVESRTLDCTAVKGLTQHQAWAWLVSALTQLAGIRMEGPAWQVVSRLGFQHAVRQLLQAIQEGPELRCLMIHAIEHIRFDALDDLIQAYEAFQGKLDQEPRFNLLLAGSVATDKIRVEGSGSVLTLQDFARPEAIEALVEDLGPLEAHRLAAVVEVIGGIPAVIETLAAGGEQHLSDLVADSDALWSLLGPLAGEIRGAFEIVHADDTLSERLERLATDGPLAEDPSVDSKLLLAGLTCRQPREKVAVRAPAFTDYILAS